MLNKTNTRSHLLAVYDAAEAEWVASVNERYTLARGDVAIEQSELEGIADRVVRFARGLSADLDQLNLSLDDVATPTLVADCVIDTALNYALSVEAGRFVAALVRLRLGEA